MSTSATIFEQDGQTTNRRGRPREPLKWVVLVYFGENNWGKLLNMNESGMCLEFAEPPAPGERIRFAFEAMGRTPAQFGGEIVSDTFQAAGEIKWTREFERIAGVQFAELGEESREQIRRWLSFEAFNDTATRGEEVKWKASALPPELLEREGSATAGPCEKTDGDGSEAGLERSESESESESAVETVGTLEPQLVAKILEAPTFQAYSKLLADEERKRGPASGLRRWLTRIGLVAASGCLAILVAAGVRVILPAWARRSEAAERIPRPSASESEPISAKYRPSARNPNPFLVEVQDGQNRRWLLWFVNKPSKTMAEQAAHKFALPSSPAPPAKAAGLARQPATTRPEPAHEFKLAAPKVNRAGVNGLTENSASNTVPVVPGGTPPLEAAIGGILARRPAPVPVGQPLPVGGQVQEARLIKSVPPAYPVLARANHVTGDVTLDALIDATGKVTDVKVVSGPTLLRGAAMDAVRLWKYEPARLDGQPASTHLSVTVKFHSQ
jgi:protein TonB